MGVGDKVALQSGGYSGRPLTKKLGLKQGFVIKLVNAPDHYFDLLPDLPADLNFNASESDRKDFIHFFTRDEKEYLALLPGLKAQLKPDGMLWVSWPKKASKAVTQVNEEIIRNFALEIGMVDIKVCAIDEIWSALKLVIPVKDR